MIHWVNDVFSEHLLNQLLHLILTCAVVSAAAAAAAAAEMELREAKEGENVTISIHVPTSEKDPQYYIVFINGTSEEPAAQLICHNHSCEQDCLKPGLLLQFDAGNLTLTLLKVSRSQMGLYKMYNPSSKQNKEKIFNITVHEPPPERPPDPPPSSMYSSSSTAGIAAGVVVSIVVLVIAVKRWKHKKANNTAQENSANFASPVLERGFLPENNLML